MRTFKLMILFTLAIGMTACASDDDTNCGMTGCNNPPAPDTCGNEACELDTGENTMNCPEDCVTSDGPCGDGLCDSAGGETVFTCSMDCPLGTCGNGNCDGSETTDSCPADCH